MTASTSLEGLRSVTKKFIIPSDLMSKLQPRKKIPKTTVRERTHITAIWTILMMKRLLSSGTAAVKPLSVTTDEKLQHRRISSVRLEKVPLSVRLNVVFMSAAVQKKTLKSPRIQAVPIWKSEHARNCVKSVRKVRRAYPTSLVWRTGVPWRAPALIHSNYTELFCLTAHLLGWKHRKSRCDGRWLPTHTSSCLVTPPTVKLVVLQCSDLQNNWHFWKMNETLINLWKSDNFRDDGQKKNPIIGMWVFDV